MAVKKSSGTSRVSMGAHAFVSGGEHRKESSQTGDGQTQSHTHTHRG